MGAIAIFLTLFLDFAKADMLEVEKLKFEPKSVTVDSEDRGFRWGLYANPFMAAGLVAEIPRAPKQRWVISAVLTPQWRAYFMPKEFEPSATIGHVSVTSKLKIELKARFDHAIYENPSKTWNAFASLGGTLTGNAVEARFHRRVCGLWCGFEAEPFAGQDFNDIYLSAGPALGIRWLDRTLGGIKTDLAIFIELHRRLGSPPEVISPDGRLVDWYNDNLRPINLEATF